MQRTRTRGLEWVVAVVLSGCAQPAPPAVAPPARNLDAERRLDGAATVREEVEAKLAAVLRRDRERCEFQVGDCAIQVDEERDQLMKSERLVECNVMPDRAAKTRCLADELVKREKHADLAALYGNDTACMRTVLECVDQLDKSAARVAVEVRAGERQRELAALPRGAAATSAAATTEAKAGYLRSTLPPSQATACEPGDEVERCIRAANADEDSFEKELDKDDYDPAIALGLLERSAQARLLCGKPELDCLSKTLEAYGLYPEAKKWVASNLALLERRQELSVGLPQAPRARCVNGASKEHQARIVDAYVAYVHEPVLFFRMKLDKAFLAMHESQVACLASQPRGPARANGQAALSKP
jgi:hypothetical protein